MTEAPVDELRCMIVVDDDDDDANVVAPGEVVFCDDLELETFAGRRNDANVVTVDRWGTWIGAAAPLRDDGGGVVGLVVANRSPGEDLPAGVLRSAVSDTFSEIMHTAGVRQTRAEIESMTDALTGLYNHRRFHELLHDAVEGARLNDGDVAVLFCDIDHFKQLNDRHGHLVGDEVLRRVSRILSASVRRGDIAARYGGDEFGVLLQGADTGDRDRGRGAHPRACRRAVGGTWRRLDNHQHRRRHARRPRRRGVAGERRPGDVRGQGERPRPRGARRHAGGGAGASRVSALSHPARRRAQRGGAARRLSAAARTGRRAPAA